ncbi:hypothetical protein KAX75_01235, partial [candidate division WOR-3 bacterium]|nr:hypothetical protein [candidate division WOR-3 bacterium]
MAIFELRRDKALLENAIKEASDFIDIVTFQFTSENIVKLLVKKAIQGVRIRIITLPEDSYRDVSERKKITELYNFLTSKDIELNRCIWEVGVPELTETSLSGEQTEGGGNKWYALHGKFVVTDKKAFALSTNFTDEKQLEVYLLYDDKDIIKDFRKKFDKIKDLFCSKQEILPGSLYFQLPTGVQQEIKTLYERTKRINVKDYPPEVSPDAEIIKGFFLSPFEGRARIFLNNMIDQAEEFIYLSTERLFDDQIVKKLLSKAYMTDIPMKILTGHPRAVRQNPAKAEKMVEDLMAAGVEFAIIDDVHAKFWITEKYICVGSSNIGK